MHYSNRQPAKGGVIDSTVHINLKKGQTLVAQPRRVLINNEQLARIRQLFQLADFQLVTKSPAGIQQQMRTVIKTAEENIRTVGRIGGSRFEQVVLDLQYACVHEEGDTNPPRNFKTAVEAILHG